MEFEYIMQLPYSLQYANNVDVVDILYDDDDDYGNVDDYDDNYMNENGI